MRESHLLLLMRLRIPVILLVLAATAGPIKFRSPSINLIDFNLGVSDILLNIIGYVPIGVVLAYLGALPALLFGTLISIMAEVGQLFIQNRYPSPADIVSNIVGTLIGFIFAKKYGIQDPTIPLHQHTAVLALMGIIILFGVNIAASWQDIIKLPSNERGLTLPGTLEGYWRFDKVDKGITSDSSTNDLNEMLINDARIVTEPRGSSNGVLQLNSPKGFVSLASSVALRLTGSMTVSAWINAFTFPYDDAVILSSFGERQGGYQLDATVGGSARTIGFIVTDLCGNQMRRYGATPLTKNTWYHVAGVYDAKAQTLDVYLNGRLDNGALNGQVSTGQQPSVYPVYIGNRPDSDRYPFTGFIDDLRIYSMPLNQDEITADMRGTLIFEPSFRNSGVNHVGEDISVQPDGLNFCILTLTTRDTLLPLLAVSIGLLVAIAITGFCGKPNLLLILLCLIGGLVSGFLVILTGVSAHLWVNFWLLPLYGVVGAISVVASVYVKLKDENI